MRNKIRLEVKPHNSFNVGKRGTPGLRACVSQRLESFIPVSGSSSARVRKTDGIWIRKGGKASE